MCRLVAYMGHDILLEDVLVKPSNSIISQSLHAQESSIPTNGDGFGLGWYAPHISEEPALFTSISPAWNDHNLLHLTAKIKSPAFFAHVRAASAGGVTHYNCHPFIHRHWMLMHNGGIHDFIKIKRHLRHLLDDDIYHWLKGETDSEHIFALFLQLAKHQKITHVNVAVDILQETFKQIDHLIKQYGTPGNSYYNICLTDGKHLIASRHCTSKHVKPETLHFSKQHHKRILVASEKLTDVDTEWETVQPYHIIAVDSEFNITEHALT